MKRSILLVSIVLFSSVFFATDVYSQDSSGSGTLPTNPPNSCNGTCGSNDNCQSGLVCYQEPGQTTKYCRNPSCQSQTSCNCPTTTATPTSTPSSTKTPSPSPSPKPTVTPTFTPTVAPTEEPMVTEEPTPTESSTPASSGGINIKNIAIGSLVLGFLLIVGGILYLKKKGKDRIPPIGVFDP